MTSREQYLADCAALWDESDNRPCFIFGQPRSQVGLFAGAMATHTIGDWLCIHLGDGADVRQLHQLIERLQASGDAHAAH